jgi:hypothetical protein
LSRTRFSGTDQRDDLGSTDCFAVFPSMHHDKLNGCGFPDARRRAARHLARRGFNWNADVGEPPLRGNDWIAEIQFVLVKSASATPRAGLGINWGSSARARANSFSGTVQPGRWLH